VIIFVPKIKNEAKGKTIRHYFGHPKGFDRGHFDHLKGTRLSAEFSKAIRPL